MTRARNLDFASAWRELKTYEGANSMDSARFYEAYCSGRIPVSPVAMRWATMYEAFLELAPEEHADDLDHRLIPA